jgi:hypothetical protein
MLRSTARSTLSLYRALQRASRSTRCIAKRVAHGYMPSVCPRYALSYALRVVHMHGTCMAHARRMHGTGCIHQVPAAPYAHEYAFPHGGGGVAILLGNERHGLSPEMLSLCDGVVSYVEDSRREAPASSLSSTPHPRQIKLRAASSPGQPRPASSNWQICSGWPSTPVLSST